MKKLTTFLLTVLMSATLILSACGKVKSNFDINWDIDLNNKINLNVLFQNSGTSDSNFNDKNKYVIKMFEEDTGYKANYAQLPASGADEIVSNHIMNREPYHMMKLSRAQFEMNVFDGAFLPLNDLLDKWGPNLKSKVKESAWASATLDGKIYAIPETGFGYMQDFALVCRTDMFKAAGVTDTGTAAGNVVLPETIEEFELALSKLQTRYGSDTQYKAFGYAGATTVIKSIAGALGLPPRYYDDNGEIKHYIESPEMLEYLELTGSWVQSGYSAKSFVTTTQQNVMANLASGKISIGYLPYWYVNPLYSMIESNNSGIEAESIIDWIPNLKNSSGEISLTAEEDISYYITIPFYMAENSGYTIDWLDKRMSDETWTKMSIGEEGIHYNIVDGIKIKTNKFDEILDNSFYQTGGNMDVSRDCWLFREQIFNSWPVLISREDEEKYVKTTALNGAPSFKSFSKLRERGESFMLGNFQNIMSQNSGRTGWQSAINVWKAKTWTAEVSREINSWYSSKK